LGPMYVFILASTLVPTAAITMDNNHK